MTNTDIHIERIKPHDVELQITTAGEGPLVVLIHGFPETSYSWRHQIPAIAQSGYKVIAPDMRGYATSDAPENITDYDIFHLTADIAGLIRHYGGGPATVVGHDWGAMVTWAFAQFRPDLLNGIAAMSVPYMPPIEMSLIDILKANTGDGFHYILYFQEPGEAEKELDADPINTMRRILWLGSGDIDLTQINTGEDRTGFLDGNIPEGLPPWLTQGDLDAYSQAFMKSGFTGGLNWYRNLHRNWELTKPWQHGPITVPTLFMAGTKDMVLASSGPVDENHPMLAFQSQYVNDVELAFIEGAGHWNQQENPEQTNQALLEFLKKVSPAN